MHPLLYELNTRCWLQDLSTQYARSITLADVPESEFGRWEKLGFTHVWLMGVWTTGPRARAQALQDAGLRREYDEALPGWTEADVTGSPYAIGDYNVPAALGGNSGLQAFRQKLNAKGFKLVLDFVPNHLGLDHPWVRERPELFVQSPQPRPETFAQETSAGIRWLAHGKDPYFPGWTDTVQLDYRRPATRTAMTELLSSVADRCDGVRCDMAMLLLNDIFAKTWQNFPVLDAGSGVRAEFWSSAISAIKQSHPNFLFLAEAYWALEGRLQQLGFDYTYDKALYDGLVSRNAAEVQRLLLSAPPEYVRASAHFLENHDEPRIAALAAPVDLRAFAVLILGLPGMRFLHEGQLSGARIRVPVQLARRAVETKQPEIEKLYEQLLATLPATTVGHGKASLLQPRAAWPGNPTAQNFVIVQWQTEPPDFDLVVVNLAPHRSQCYATLAIEGLADHNWTMKDRLGPEVYQRAGDDLQNQGLYLDLPASGAQLFHFTPS